MFVEVIKRFLRTTEEKVVDGYQAEKGNLTIF